MNPYELLHHGTVPGAGSAAIEVPAGAITTEASDPIMTESGDYIILE